MKKIRINNNYILLYVLFFALPTIAQEAISIKKVESIQISEIKRQIHDLRSDLIWAATQTELDRLFPIAKFLLENINKLDDSISEKKILMRKIRGAIEDCGFLYDWGHSSIEDQIIFIMEFESLVKTPIEMLVCMKFARTTRENIDKDKTLTPQQRKDMKKKLDYIITGSSSDSDSQDILVKSSLICVAQ